MPPSLCFEGRRTADERFSAEGEPVELLDQIFRLHYSTLLSYTLKLTLGDRTKAEDIVQETMLRAWRNITLFESADKVRPWLFIVARNIAIDKARSTAARPVECGADLIDFVPAAVDPIDNVAAALDARAILLSLSPIHRSVLVNLYLRDMTLEETAAVLRIPIGTVKSRAHNALRAARRAVNMRRASALRSRTEHGTAGHSVRRCA